MTVKYLVWQRQQQQNLLNSSENWTLFLYTLLKCPRPWILGSFSLFLFSYFFFVCLFVCFLFKIELFQNKFREKRKNKYYNLEGDRVAKCLAHSILNGMRRFLVHKHFFCFNCVCHNRRLFKSPFKTANYNLKLLKSNYCRENGMHIHGTVLVEI